MNLSKYLEEQLGEVDIREGHWWRNSKEE